MLSSKKTLLLSTLPLLALAGCETVAEEANEAVGFEYTAMLAPTGNGTGSGKAEISLNDATNMICTDLELSGVGTVSAAHIMGPGDSVVVNVDSPDDDDSDDCDTVSDAVLDAIKANPAGYYAHVVASTGELRGTLRKE